MKYFLSGDRFELQRSTISHVFVTCASFSRKLRNGSCGNDIICLVADITEEKKNITETKEIIIEW